MGIRGLEKLVDEVCLKNPSLLESKRLRDLKLVIDGNQLAYVIQLKQSHESIYGGGYDQIRQQTHLILSKLKPFTECIVFNGAKELVSKAVKDLKKRVCQVANLNRQSEDHLTTLLRIPPLFMKTIIFELCEQLKIKCFMPSGSIEHFIACYANTDLDTFTILSSDSCFYVYELEKGFVSFKYKLIEEMLRCPEKINGNTEIPVFYLSPLMEHLGMREHVTWVYFCLMLGDNDADLWRNTDYLRSEGIETRSGLRPLVQHFSNNELSFLRSNFATIRRSYATKSNESKVDELLDVYQFKKEAPQAVVSTSGQISEFDRFIETIKKVGANFSWCCVEDCREETTVSIAKRNNLLKYIYLKIYEKSSSSREVQIDEYNRVKSNSLENCVKVEKVRFRVNDHIDELDFLMNYLEKRNNDAEEYQDDLALLLTALSMWHKWMDENRYQRDIKSLYSPQSFIDAIILNYLLISIKNLIDNLSAEGSSTHHRFQAKIKQLVKSNPRKLKSLVSIYDQIISYVGMADFQTFLREDLRAVHRINEFQSVYFVLAVINKLNGYQNLGFLSPSLFMNCFFQFSIIQSTSSKIPVNGKSATEKARELCKLMRDDADLKLLIDELHGLVDLNSRELYDKRDEAKSSTSSDLSDALEKLNVN